MGLLVKARLLHAASKMKVGNAFRQIGLLRQCVNQGRIKSQRAFGQPAAQTHPHLMKQGEVTPGITQAEYKLRRTTLISNIAHQFKSVNSIKDHIMIFPSASKTYMTYDIPYPFRQNTDFLYLCGFQEPDSVLVLHTTPDGYKSALFVPKRDASKELWDGPRSGDSGAVQLTGVSHAFNIDRLDQYLYQYCKDYKDFMIWYNYGKPVHQQFHDKYIATFLKQDGKKGMENPTPAVQKQRLIKSDSEIELMKQTTLIASKAFIDVMKFSYAEINESKLYAKMDFECRMREAEILAYPPVVAGGDRANTIHYINNDQLIHDGELVLMDAGCEYHGYTSDITRTWPVSGRFSEPQRALYMAVLEVQCACVRLCTTEHSLADIYREMMGLLAAQLLKLGIVSESLVEDRVKLIKKTEELCPHHVGHYLGMDVHDTSYISKNQKLQPGMVITIEPGLYVRKDRHDVPEKYRGIGIRIEDDVLITSSGPLVLTEACPKHPDDIENIMASR